MKSEARHADDREIQALLAADEDSAEFRAAAAHVETCEHCRERLSELAGSTAICESARELLLDYPWEDLPHTQFSGDPFGAVHRELKIDFLGPPSHPEMLGRLGRYEIERVIGSGGMGIVLKAFDMELNRPVAVKVLAHHLAHSGAARQRFAREAKAAAAVVHEHVVAIHNVDADRDLPFLVMHYVSGRSLQARVDREGPLDAKEILRIALQTAAGLAAAHEQGVIHRDVKPGNILLENGVERVLLTDFGLARTVDDASLTHTGILAGTPHYMSPEQANGDAVDHRSDLFSLGAVMYFMATGHPPFRAERAMGVLNRICHEPHQPVRRVNAEIPEALADIIDRLLEKKPSQRFASAAELREALAKLLAQWQLYGPSRRRTTNSRVRNAIVIGAIGLASVVGAIALMISGGLFSHRGERPSSRNNPETTPVSAEVYEAFLISEEADAQEFQNIEGRLMRLESMSHESTYSPAAVDAFALSTDEIERRLDELDGQASFTPSTR